MREREAVTPHECIDCSSVYRHKQQEQCEQQEGEHSLWNLCSGYTSAKPLADRMTSPMVVPMPWKLPFSASVFRIWSHMTHVITQTVNTTRKSEQHITVANVIKKNS